MVLNVPMQLTEAINANKQSSMRVSKYFKVNEPIDKIMHKKKMKSMHGNTNWPTFLRLLDDPTGSGCILNQISTFLVFANGSIKQQFTIIFLINKMQILLFKSRMVKKLLLVRTLRNTSQFMLCNHYQFQLYETIQMAE